MLFGMEKDFVLKISIYLLRFQTNFLNSPGIKQELLFISLIL